VSAAGILPLFSHATRRPRPHKALPNPLQATRALLSQPRFPPLPRPTAAPFPPTRNLAVLSLRMNQLTGTLPRDWNTPSLEMLLLSDNQLSGWLPPALAQQPRLGTLRLEGNRLDGGLGAFASALPKEGSPLFHLDVSRNAFGGDLPSGLERLGVFSRDAQFVAGTAGGQVGGPPRAGGGRAGPPANGFGVMGDRGAAGGRSRTGQRTRARHAPPNPLPLRRARPAPPTLSPPSRSPLPACSTPRTRG
jgi:hypothetical protein